MISYNGDDKYALGVSDGVTTPLVVNGTLVELQTAIAEKLPGYLELAAKEAAYEEAEHAAKFAELLGEVVTDSTKKNLEMRVDAEYVL